MKAAVPVDTICMIIPRLKPLISSPCKKETMTVSRSDHAGEIVREHIKIITSAGSYSRNAAEGNIGMCMKYTKASEIAANIARTTIFSRVLFFIALPPNKEMPAINRGTTLRRNLFPSGLSPKGQYRRSRNFTVSAPRRLGVSGL